MEKKLGLAIVSLGANAWNLGDDRWVCLDLCRKIGFGEENKARIPISGASE